MPIQAPLISVNKPLPVGLIAGLTAVATNGLNLVLSRLELAALELTAVRFQLIRLIAVFSLALSFIWFTLAGIVALIILLNWDRMGWHIIGVLTGIFTVIALSLVLYARFLFIHSNFTLPETLAELQADRETLG